MVPYLYIPDSILCLSFVTIPMRVPMKTKVHPPFVDNNNLFILSGLSYFGENDYIGWREEVGPIRNNPRSQ